VKLVFIAGKFSGTHAWDIACDAHHAEAVAMRVAKLGGMPVVPQSLGRVLSGVVADSFWRDGCLLLLSRCDGMLRLPSWGDSPDTIAQSSFAERNGIDRWGIAHLSDPRFFKWLNYPAERGAGIQAAIERDKGRQA
jgi:hypothetical protein